MASRSLSLWLTLSALILGVAGCDCGGGGTPPLPPPPPSKDLPDATLSKVEVDRTGGVKANDRDEVTITVTVVKADGAALADRTVRLEVTGEGNTVTPSVGVTNAQGVMTAKLVSTRAGTKRVTATVDDAGGAVPLGTLPTVEFVPLAAAQLVFATTSIQATAGAPIVLEVELQDDEGYRAYDATGTVTLELATGPAGGVIVDGTATADAVDGVARFTEVRIEKAGEGYSLRATSEGLTEAISSDFEVVPAAATSLELAAPVSMTAGASTSVSVTARDAFTNIATGYTGMVRFSSTDTRAMLPAEATFTAADLGQKVITGLSLRSAGTQRVTVTDTVTATITGFADLQVGAADPSGLVFRRQPATSPVHAVLSPVEVALVDAFGNFPQLSAPAVTVALTGGQTLNGTKTVAPADGVASFSDLSIPQEGTGYTLTATAPGLTAAVSDAFNITSTQLVFTVQPVNTTAGTAMADVRVALQDASGTTIPSASVAITLTLLNGPAFSRTETSVNGVATFSNMNFTVAGSGYLFEASSSGLPTKQSNTFAILAGSATTLELAVLSDPVVAGVSNNLEVTLTDTFGNAATGYTGTVHFTSSDANAVLPGDYTFTAADQGSKVRPVEMRTAGLRTITVTDTTNGALTDEVTVTVSPGNPARLVFSQQPADGMVGTTLGTVSVTLQDAFGNDTPRSSPSVSLGLTGGNPAATLGGTLNVPPVDGVASFTDLSINQAGTGFQLVATASGLTSATSEAFDIQGQPEAGNLVISEFSALGAEFIELYNPTGAAIDVRGYTFRNAAAQEADIRAPNDPNGTGSTPVQVPAGGFLHGIPNPSGAIPAGVGFVFGAPGTTFALADTGDSVSLHAAGTGALEDRVNFSTFVTDPNTPLTGTSFVGFAGSSTQLDAANLTAAANDTATQWCVSFYAAGGKTSRVTNTAGAANASCGVAVLNEVYFRSHGFDEKNTFVEIAGPGGSVIGGAKIRDVEGKNPGAGNLITDNQTNPGDVDGEFTFPAGTRIPVDGFLIVADADPAGDTFVPNVVDGVDFKVRDMDLADGPSKSVQLVSASGTLLDALGYDPAGAPLDATTASNGLAMFETATARGQTATTLVGSSLARAPTSVDTNNNFNDFHIDPSPTPGMANDAVNFTVTSLTPNDGPATGGQSGILAVGTDFTPGLRAQFGAGVTGPCTVTSSSTATCSTMANAGAVGTTVNVTFSNNSNVGVPNFVLASSFTYTGSENETNSALEADLCSLVGPATLTVTENQATTQITGRILEVGVTEAPGAAGGILAEVGYGTNGTNPRASNSWRFFSATHSADAANGDEYVGTFVAPDVTTTINYSYTFRFSQDGGMRWTYCDLDGAGSNAGADFSNTQLGVMTVTP